MKGKFRSLRQDLDHAIALLDKQRPSAAAADIEALGRITDDLSKLCDRVETYQGPVSQADLERLGRLRHSALAGQETLQALMSGLGTVITELRRSSISERHGVYGPSGERQQMELSGNRLEKRR